VLPFQWRNVIANLALIQKITFTRPVSRPLWILPYQIQMYMVFWRYSFLQKRWYQAYCDVGKRQLGYDVLPKTCTT